MENSTINCPHCGGTIDVNEVIFDNLQKQFLTKESELKQKLDLQQQQLNEQQQQIQKQIDDGIRESLAKEREKLTQQIRQDVQTEQSDQIKLLRQQLDEKSAKMKELYAAQATIEQLKREKDELSDKLKAESQLMINETLTLERDKIRKSAEEANLMKLQDKEHVIQQLKEQLAIASRKAEQGSMQTQGEVQEVALDNLLAATYPFDIIKEVPKGIRGADTIQTVINTMQQECGSIIYESKRTKRFASERIDKLKQDQITSKADIAVLVTESMPLDMERFGEREGVWICGFNEVKSLSFVLREMIIRIHSTKMFQENKGSKMELLYTYLTSNEFVQNVRRIVENYNSMIDQLNSEKKAMHKIWAIREKQIWVVQENLSSLFGSIKGIAGNAVPELPLLELGIGEEIEGTDV
jgi:hypothetical protein